MSEKLLDQRFFNYQRQRRKHWDAVADSLVRWQGLGYSYHKRLTEVYTNIIPTGAKILEVGCAQGDLLAALKPKLGVGIDLSSKMLQIAIKRYPNLYFIQNDVHSLSLTDDFDFIILSDLINDLWDFQSVLSTLKRVASPSTRIIINSYSRLWELPLALTEKLGLAKPNLDLNWFTVEDVANLLDLEGYDFIRHWEEILIPIPLSFLSAFCNRFLVRFWPFRHFALTNFIVARPDSTKRPDPANPSVSVIVPARNEAGNIASLLDRLPQMGSHTEIIFVEGHSTDKTWETIVREIRAHPERTAVSYMQEGEGKGDAVRLGFERANGDILLILDADLTVPPEQLPKFFAVLKQGKGEFANGVRLVYPIEQQGMRYLNLIGNKFFGHLFSWLIGQNVKDTLCGTKGLWKRDYGMIRANRSYFGEIDPFGDFDLLLGAARLNMRIVDIPIRYQSRTYGSTNIKRWKHGWLLLIMSWKAAMKLKFQ